MAADAPFTIVVGVDGSAQSRAAMDWAVEEARLRHGSILALTAWHYPYVSDALGQSWDYEIFRTDAQVILDEELDRVRGAGVPVDGHVVQGNPGAVLVEASRGADLVAVGSRGHGGFAGLLLGSVSSQAVHHAHCPVLVFREPPAREGPA